MIAAIFRSGCPIEARRLAAPRASSCLDCVAGPSAKRQTSAADMAMPQRQLVGPVCVTRNELRQEQGSTAASSPDSSATPRHPTDGDAVEPMVQPIERRHGQGRPRYAHREGAERLPGCGFARRRGPARRGGRARGGPAHMGPGSGEPTLTLEAADAGKYRAAWTADQRLLAIGMLGALSPSPNPCIRKGVSKDHICSAIVAGGRDVAAIGHACTAGTGCRSCKTEPEALLTEALEPG